MSRRVVVAGVAVLESAVAETVNYTKDRHAFGQALFDLQHTRFELAECATAKAWVADMQVAVIDRRVQLFGGYGYMLEYPIARMFVDSRAQKIYAGASEVMKELIARSL
jgi:alkylation response protein AidB-like acyl-CoA dehydrogenase